MSEPESEFIDGFDVDHLDDRPDDLEHVAIKEGPDGGLQAIPHKTSDAPPGYGDRIPVVLMEWGQVCQYVSLASDYDRPINFHPVPASEWVMPE